MVGGMGPIQCDALRNASSTHVSWIAALSGPGYMSFPVVCQAWRLVLHSIGLISSMYLPTLC